MAHYTTKRRYVQGIQFAKHAERVRGVIRLENAPADDPNRLSVTALEGHAAVAVLLRSVKNTPTGARKATAFNRINDLARAAPVALITLPDDLGRMAEARALIVGWAAAQSSAR